MNRFERLRNYISEKEGKILSARELARLLGVDNSAISRVEAGNGKPSYKAARALEEKYGIPEGWYLKEEGLAPWEKEEEDAITWRIADEQLKQGKKGGALLFASGKILESGERELAEYWIRAGREPVFRSYIYIVLAGAVRAFNELQEKPVAAPAQVVAHPAHAPAPAERPALEPAAAPAGKTYWLGSGELAQIRQAAEPSILQRDFPELAARLEALAVNPQKMFLLSKLLEELEEKEKKPEEKP